TLPQHSNPASLQVSPVQAHAWCHIARQMAHQLRQPPTAAVNLALRMAATSRPVPSTGYHIGPGSLLERRPVSARSVHGDSATAPGGRDGQSDEVRTRFMDRSISNITPPTTRTLMRGTATWAARTPWHSDPKLSCPSAVASWHPCGRRSASLLGGASLCSQ